MSSEPRPLGSPEVESFMRASEQRKPTLNKRQRQTFIDDLTRRHRFTMRRLQADLRWLRRQAMKRGIDPEEVRWMLW